ncbi:MAG: hypothetical protein BWK76_18275 [Desulfobulbaceae bacterium A2]|nr:MAG: hypothetical protein BWK76_18275 [Desulfobulbaceae bacterium A2]
MSVQSDVLALVPARGGSKSIPKKNLASLAGRPLLDYGVFAALACGRCNRIVCSTDDNEIAVRAGTLGIEVDWRPAALATDDAAVADVAREFLQRQATMPEIVVLVQPTSPFLLSEHIAKLLDLMHAQPEAKSGQTIASIPHNYHAWNQRLVENDHVRFHFAAERRHAHNKQRKPQLFCFGNLVAARSQALLAGGDFFVEPSVGYLIDWPYNLDVDGPNDLLLAGAVMQAGLVRLGHITS